MNSYGYIRVSTRDQNIARQVEAMKKEGIEEKKMFIDKQSGKDFNRKNYKRLLKKVKSGDVIFIKSIDRLGRNYEEIIQQWNIITRNKSVDIIVLDFPLLNTTQKTNGLTGRFISNLVLEILSYVAQVERENIKQRQQEGIKIAISNGVKFGRPRKEVPAAFVELYELVVDGEISIREASRRTSVSNHTFRRWMDHYEDDLDHKR